MSDELLRVSNLHVSYGGLVAVHGVDFVVNVGEIVGIFGPNGAGKSTTLQAVAGLLKEKSGQVTFRGRDISHTPAYQIARAGLALVPENRLLFPYQTVREHLELAAFVTGDKNGSTSWQQILSLFPDLKTKLEQQAGELSGGQQQMLAIARALALHPTVLMLDEPSAGLSPLLTSQLFRACSLLREQGVAILLVEQNVTEAIKLTDRSYILEGGRVELEGESRQLASDPRVQEIYLGT